VARTPASLDTPGGTSNGDPHSWRSWTTTSLIVLAIWAATALAAWNLLYFWPIWVIGPWGVVLLVRTFTGGDDDEDVTPRVGR
jgi:hypothetical protein